MKNLIVYYSRKGQNRARYARHFQNQPQPRVFRVRPRLYRSGGAVFQPRERRFKPVCDRVATLADSAGGKISRDNVRRALSDLQEERLQIFRTEVLPKPQRFGRKNFRRVKILSENAVKTVAFPEILCYNYLR